MSEVKRKKGESFESLLRRFNRRLIQSGKILQAKKVRFNKKGLNKTKRRASALRRNAIREEREYLIKTGKLREEDFKKSYRR
ncbi:MAG: 30S ribosomal protein S21 [Patescibacteria group bacterium]